MIEFFDRIGGRDDLRRWIALAVVCFGQLMIILDATVVNVALGSIQRDLHFTPTALTWVVNAYAISYGGFVLLAGRIGDLVGRKRVFLAGVLLFALASLLCGLATSPEMLVAARFLQGLGGALSAGVVIAIIVTGFREPGERAQAMSVFAFTLAGGGSLGLLAGGVLTQVATWHWVFFVNVPIGIATLIAGAILVDETEPARLDGGVDVLGSLLVTSAVMLAVYTIVGAGGAGWDSTRTLGLGTASLLLLGGFVWLQARLENPIVPLRIFRLRSLVGASAARGLLAIGIFSTFFLGSLDLRQLHGYSALGIGLAFLPFTIANGAASIGATRPLVARFGARSVLLAGLALIAAALILNSALGASAAYFPSYFAAYAAFGLGVGLAMMPLTLLAMSEVHANDAGVGAGVANVSMQVSAALGLAILGTAATGRTQALLRAGSPAAAALAGGYRVAFLGGAVAVIAALLVALLALRSPARATESAVDDEADVLEAA